MILTSYSSIVLSLATYQLVYFGAQGMAKKKQMDSENIQEKPQELQVTEEQQLKIDQLIDSTRKEGVTYWDKKITKEIFVPVDDGEIRILHVKPEKPKNKRIILFIPGWGVIADGFQDLYEGLFDSVEFYYIETREKGSSRINPIRKADMSISQNAKDIQSTIDYLGLQNTDFVLAGPCWGATIQLLGLLEKTLDAPTIIAFDPMHKLWFNRFLLDIAPIVPAFLVNWLKPLFKWVLFGNMKEKAQKKRSEDFLDSADAKKWKKAAYQARKLNLYGKLNKIQKEILVFNGTTDKVHEQIEYPKIAKELPNGRFFYLNTDESKRERMLTAVLREFALVDGKTNIPKSLREFEKKLSRS